MLSSVLLRLNRKQIRYCGCKGGIGMINKEAEDT